MTDAIRSARAGMSTDEYHLLEEAVEWFVTLNDTEATEQERTRWQRWLKQSESHQQAWHRVELVNQRFKGLAEQGQGGTAVSVLEGSQQRRLSRRRMLVGFSMFASAAVLGGLGARSAGWLPSAGAVLADYRSGIGEQRQLRLDDGSRLWLNTRTAVNVNRGKRLPMDLVEGEVVLDQRSGSSTPLQISVGDYQFELNNAWASIRRFDRDERVLALREGTVLVRSIHGQSQRLHSGQQIRLSHGQLHVTDKIRPYLFSWTHGLLQVESLELDAFAAELMRYQLGYLSVSPQVADLSVMGTFPLHDINTVYEMLTSTLPVRIDRSIPWWTRIQPA